MLLTLLLYSISCGYALGRATDSCGAEYVLPENAARFDNYRLYALYLATYYQFEALAQLYGIGDSLYFYRYPSLDRVTHVLVPAHKVADITAILEMYRVDHNILEYNFQNRIDNHFRTVRPKCTPGSNIDWDHYFHLDTIYDWLDELVARHPDKISPIDLGRSYEGRPMKGIKFSSGPGRTGIFLEGGIHAREWISTSTVTFILNQLLTSDEPAVQDLASSFDWYIVPVSNPDGYVYTFDGYRFWRKSRHPNGLCVGADLNRNFDYFWNSTGWVSHRCSINYLGTAAESEPEVANIVRFIMEHRNSSHIDTYISLHSNTQKILFPSGSTSVRVPNYADLLAIGRKGVEGMASRFHTEYTTGSIAEIMYTTTGVSVDWAYAVAGIPIAYAIELRGPVESEHKFMLPADQITPTGLETLDAFVEMLNEARRRGYYQTNNI